MAALPRSGAATESRASGPWLSDGSGFSPTTSLPMFSETDEIMRLEHFALNDAPYCRVTRQDGTVYVLDSAFDPPQRIESVQRLAGWRPVSKNVFEKFRAAALQARTTDLTVPPETAAQKGGR